MVFSHGLFLTPQRAIPAVAASSGFYCVLRTIPYGASPAVTPSTKRALSLACLRAFLAGRSCLTKVYAVEVVVEIRFVLCGGFPEYIVMMFQCNTEEEWYGLGTGLRSRVFSTVSF